MSWWFFEGLGRSLRSIRSLGRRWSGRPLWRRCCSCWILSKTTYFNRVLIQKSFKQCLILSTGLLRMMWKSRRRSVWWVQFRRFLSFWSKSTRRRFGWRQRILLGRLGIVVRRLCRCCWRRMGFIIWCCFLIIRGVRVRKIWSIWV